MCEREKGCERKKRKEETHTGGDTSSTSILVSALLSGNDSDADEFTDKRFREADSSSFDDTSSSSFTVR
jgi:hypothetical protein